MRPSIQISTAGPPEFLVLQGLRETVFGEMGHRSRSTIEASLSDRADLLVLLAQSEGRPIGFSAGFRRTAGSYYINYVAVIRDYRRQGIARQFMTRHERFARDRNYSHIEFNTFNHFPGMICLGLSQGYRPIGVEQHAGTEHDLAIRFGKRLNDPLSDQDQAEIVRVQAALGAREEIIGAMRDATGQLQTIFRAGHESPSP